MQTFTENLPGLTARIISTEPITQTLLKRRESFLVQLGIFLAKGSQDNPPEKAIVKRD